MGYAVRIADAAWSAMRTLHDDLQQRIQDRLDRIADLAPREPVLNPVWRGIGCKVALLTFVVDHYCVTYDQDDRKQMITLRGVSSR
jgi:hypothetical protein